MHFTEYFIRRPVLSISLCILILFAGLIAFFQLPVRLIPKIEMPVISINTTYPGASAQLMQGFVTSTIQNALSGIDGVDYISSASRMGESHIQLHFKIGFDSNAALVSVVAKVAALKQELPSEINEPVIRKESADDKPIMIIAFTSDQWSRLSVAEYLQRNVKPKLEMIPGVSSADVMGEQYAMRIELNPERLAENNLTPLDVAESITKQNYTSGIGSVDSFANQVDLHANTELTTPDEFNHIIIKQLPDNPLYLSAVGEAKLGPDSDKISVFVNGKAGTMIFIKPLPGANPLAIATAVDVLIRELDKTLPPEIQAKVVLDESKYIHLSLIELAKTVLVTLAIIMIVIFLCLGSLRAASIPIVTIPLSLLGAGFFLWLWSGSLNTLTLLAMVLAIGLVVDDAIIVVENIHRYLEEGLTLYQSAIQGAKEIVVSIIGMSVVLAAVYLPIAFIGGMTGKLFFEFALMIAFSVMLSGVVALVLSPMMCTRLLSFKQKPLLMVSRGVDTLKQVYHRALTTILPASKFVIGFWLLAIVMSIMLLHLLPEELAPREDQGFLQVIGEAPDSTGTRYLNHYTAQLQNIYHAEADIDRYVYINNIPDEHQFLSFITLQPWDQRKQSTRQIHGSLQAKLNLITGVQATLIEPPALPAGDGFPVQFILKSSLGYEDLYRIASLLRAKALQSGIFLFLQQDMQFDKPQLNVSVNREAANHLGVSLRDVTGNLAILLSENDLQQFSYHGQSRPVHIRMKNESQDLSQIMIKNQNGDFIPLASLVTMTQQVAPNTLNQFQKNNAIMISGVMRPGKSMNVGLALLNSQLQEIAHNSVQADYAGESREMMQEGHNNLLLFISACIVVYLVLAILFESFVMPWLILIGSVPATLFAALSTLYIVHATINIYTEIGMVTLIGLVSKHGILLVQVANRLRLEQELDATSAMLQAAMQRMRPITMTTLTMALAAVPLVFATGVGANSRFDIGIVIGSGVLFGTLFTLFLVPFFYCRFFSSR